MKSNLPCRIRRFPRQLVLNLALLAFLPAMAFAADKGRGHFDVRIDPSESSRALLQSHRPAQAGSIRAKMANGQAQLATRVPGLRIEANSVTHAPEIVDPAGGALTAPGGGKHEAAVRGFVSQNAALFGLSATQAAQLETIADYANPSGNLSWVELEQRVHGIPVFQGTIRAAIRKDGAVARTTGNLASGLDYASLPSKPKLTPAAAAAAAAETIGVKVAAKSLTLQATTEGGRKHVLSAGPFDEEIKTELVYFPLEPGSATLAYSMVLWEKRDAFYILVDAQTGALLWRKNITNDQSQNATFHVYDSDSPTPLSPTNATPGSGIQGAAVPRTPFTLVSELPAFDNLGWIPDGQNTTTGNNVDAGLDIDGNNGIDANGRPTGVPNRVFNFAYAPAGTPFEEAPTSVNYRRGVVTNLFFWSNRYHDRLYQYGFTESAGNFQTNNFGRGGAGNDFVRAEAQDSGGTDNANFATPPDGQPGRMQMYIFSNPNPQRDGDLDQEVVLHELTHGLSNRLHANGSGLNTFQSGGMGEGWSDFYARCLLSTSDEDVNGVYASGGYVTLNFFGLGTDNYYYGIRRFPYAVKTAVGPNGRPHNPMTFGDIDPDESFLTDGAFPKSPIIGDTATEVHNIGEVWCMALLEVRARIITRLGFPAGNDRVLQIVTDGMKLDPNNPTVALARDAIIAADVAGFGGQDVDDIWAGFAAMGLGFNSSAVANAQFPAAITESFITPNVVLGPVTFTDTAQGNGNGFADPGEVITLSVPLINLLPGTAAGATATVAGITANYGDIASGQTVTQQIDYTVDPATPSGTRLFVQVDIDSSFGQTGPVTPTFPLVVGEPVNGFVQNFDSLNGTTLPPGWTTTVTGAGTPWSVTTTNPDTPLRVAFTPNLANTATAEMVTPSIAISSASATLTFRNAYNLEAGAFDFYDGMVLEVSFNGGTFQDVVAAGCKFESGGYNCNIAYFDNPLAPRAAWSGLSGGTTGAPGFITTRLLLPPSAAGRTVRFKWIVGSDSSAAANGLAGAWIDGVVVANNTRSVITGNPPVVTTTPGALDYIENQTPTAIDTGLTITDSDSTSLVSGSVAFTTNFTVGQDLLVFTQQSGIVGNYNQNTGVLNLTGPATLGAFQAALRSVAYFNSSNNPFTGQRTVTFTVNDGGGPTNDGSATRDINVTPVNDAPTAGSRTVQVAEDINQAIVLTGVDAEGAPLAFTIINFPQHGQLTGTAPNLTYAPDFNYNGPDSFTFRVNDGQLDSVADATITLDVLPVNDPPTTANQNIGTNEDTTLPVVLAGADVENSPLTFTILSAPQNGTLIGTPPNVSYRPAANYFGPDGFTYKVNDGLIDSSPGVVGIAVSPVNDPPGFLVGPNQVIFNNTSPQTVGSWATNIVPGPANENAQTVSFIVTVDNPAYFTTQPAVASDGTLTYQPAPNTFAISQCTVVAKDNAGGADTSAPQPFQILINPPNFAPTFVVGPSVIVGQGSGAYSQPWASGVSPGPAFESTQTVNFLVSNDHPELFTVAPGIAPNGTLSFTPGATASGVANITVRLHDDGGIAHNGVDTGAPVVFKIAVSTFVEEIGIYNGLVQAAPSGVREQGRYGTVRATFSRTGAVTGKIKLAGKRYPLKGVTGLTGGVLFGKTATATLPLKRPGQTTLQLTLQLDAAFGTDQLGGTIVDGSAGFSTLLADRALYTAAANPVAPMLNPPASLIGKYTAVFGARTPAQQGIPSDLYAQGDGIGFITVKRNGSAKLAVTLADGAKVSAGNALSKDNVLPFYVLTDNKKGSVTGRVTFRTVAGASDLDGVGLVWIKPYNPQAAIYRGGWPHGVNLDVIGSHFAPGTVPTLPGLAQPDADGNADIVLADGGLTVPGVAKGVNIDPANQALTVLPSTDKLALKINAKTGALSGDFIFPVTNRRTEIKGVILQTPRRGSGFFISHLGSGHFLLTPDAP